MLKLKRTFDTFTVSDQQQPHEEGETGQNMNAFASPPYNSPFHYQPPPENARAAKRRRQLFEDQQLQQQKQQQQVPYSPLVQTPPIPQQSNSLPSPQNSRQFQEFLDKRQKVNYFPTAQELGLPSAQVLIQSYKTQRKAHRKLAKQQPQNYINENRNNATKQELEIELGEQKKTNKQMFTEDEIQLIIKLRDRQLQDQYNRILQERLQEQFNQFAQFNHDYISRQFKSSDFSYTS